MQSGLCPLSLVYLLKSDVSWSRYSSKYSSLWCICSNQICLGLDIRRSYQRRSIDEVWVWGQPKIAFCQSMIRSVKYRSCITPLFTADDYLRLYYLPKKYISFLRKSQQVVIKSLAKKIITMDWLKWNPECRHLNSNGAFAYGTHLVLTTFFICAKPNSLSAALIKNAPVFIAAILAVSMWNGPEAHETKYNWKIFQHFLRNMKTDYAALFSRVFQF